MVFGECRKVFGSNFFWIIVCIALLINLLMLSGFEPENTGKIQMAYSDYLQKIIETAQYKLDEYRIMGYSDDAFVCEYQQQVIDTYTGLIHLPVEMYSSPNWQLLFSYNGSSILLILCAFLCGFIVFYADRFNGTIQIVRTTRNGRMIAGLTKIITVLICSILITFLFEAAEIVYSVVTQGAYKITDPLQTVPGMELCPYSWTIWEGLLVRFGIHLLCFAVSLFLACVLTALLDSYILIYLYGIVLLGCQYILAVLPFLNPYSFLNVVNLFKIADLDFLIKFSAVWIQDNCILSGTAIVITSLLVILVCGILTVICFTVRRYKKSTFPLQKLLHRMNTHHSVSIDNLFSVGHVSVFKYEAYKIFCKPTAVFLVIVYVLIQAYSVAQAFQPDLSYSDNQYRKHMEYLEGEPTEEKADYIRKKLQYTMDVIGREFLVHEQYINNEISSAEYNDFQIEYHKCLEESPVLQRVNTQYNRCVALRESGYDALLLYDTGWIHYFTRDADYFLIIGLILLLSGIVSHESENGILPIIRTTVNGRRNTLRKKYLVAIVGCTVGWCISEVLSIVFCYSNFYLPGWEASIYSIQYSFGEINFTIYQYALITMGIHLVGFILLGVMITSASLLLKKTYVVILTGVLLYLLQPILHFFTVEFTAAPDSFMHSGSFHGTAYLLWFGIAVLLSIVSWGKYCNWRNTV